MIEHNEKLQLDCLAMLEQFIRIAEKHHFQWFADSGTLLGCVRTGEFIPWDDDCDVAMPRKDYDEFEKIATSELQPPFRFQSPLTEEYISVNSKIRLDNTQHLILVDDMNRKYNKGLFIDIFPIDSIPDNEEEYRAELGFMRTIDKCLPENVRYSNHDVFYNLLNKVLGEMTKKWSKSKYVSDIIFNYHTRFNNVKILRSSYDKIEKKAFYDTEHKKKLMLNIPAGYDDILSNWYGKDWRIPKHVYPAHITSSIKV